MSKIAIHAGIYKTGSTFIQNTLWENQDLLAEKSIHFAQTGLLKGSPRVGYRHLFLKRSLLMEQENSMAFAHLVDEAQANGGITIVSHEGLFLPDIEPRALAHCLRNIDYTIVIYLRNPIDYIESKYRQWITGSHNFSGEIENFLARHRECIQYKKMVAEWEAVFGNKVKFRAYEAVKDLVQDFLIQSGVEKGIELIPTSVKNESKKNSNHFLYRLIGNKFKALGVKVSYKDIDRIPKAEIPDGRLLSDEQVQDLLKSEVADYLELVERFGFDPEICKSKIATKERVMTFFDQELRERAYKEVESTLATEDDLLLAAELMPTKAPTVKPVKPNKLKAILQKFKKKTKTP